MKTELAAAYPELVETLRLAVPLHMDELRNATPGQLQHIAQRAGSVVASKGDALQFKGKSKATRDATAEAFSALARGLAALALAAEGGVDFAGLHFCGTPHEGCPTPRRSR